MNDGGPAFALHVPYEFQVHREVMNYGMTLRDYFAAAALTGVLNDPWYTEQKSKPYRLLGEHIAVDCYAIADAMLAEREKKHE